MEDLMTATRNWQICYLTVFTICDHKFEELLNCGIHVSSSISADLTPFVIPYLPINDLIFDVEVMETIPVDVEILWYSLGYVVISDIRQYLKKKRSNNTDNKRNKMSN